MYLIVYAVYLYAIVQFCETNKYYYYYRVSKTASLSWQELAVVGRGFEVFTMYKGTLCKGAYGDTCIYSTSITIAILLNFVHVYLQGSMCKDCGCACCCGNVSAYFAGLIPCGIPLVLCQMARELKLMGHAM